GGAQSCGRGAAGQPLGLDLLAEALHAEGTHQNLDARLVDVVAAAMAVVDAQDGLEVGQEVRQWQELTDHATDDRRAPEAAAHQHLKANRTLGVAAHVQTDVVHLGGGAVGRRAGDRDLELAREIGEFGIQCCPLTHDLAVGPRIVELIRRDSGEMVGCHIADTIAAGLDGMHLDRGELPQDLRHLLEAGPVELQVLAGGEMPGAPVEAFRDLPELAQLTRAEQPVGNGNAQHGGMTLDVQTIAQPQAPELVLRQFAGQEAPGLVGELRDPLIDKRLVELVIAIHDQTIGARAGRTEIPFGWVFGAAGYERVTMPEACARLRLRRRSFWVPGLYFEEFEVGQRFEHAVRRTVTETDNVLFSTLTMN